jgi:hypothetical protein
MVDMKRIEREIEADRKAVAEKKRKEEALWAKVHNSPPAETPGNFRVYFAKRSNGPCIYEYHGRKTNFWGTRQPNKPVPRLSYPNQQNRKYYQAGDRILHGEVDERFLYDLFPELPKPDDTKAEWTDLLWWALNEGETEKYKYCWVIKSIHPDGRGGGYVKLSGEINFEGHNVRLGKIHERKRLELNGNFVNASIDWSVLQFFAKATVTVSMVALQGISKSVQAPAKILARKVLFKEMKKRTSKRFRRIVFRAVYHRLVRTLASSGKAFCLTFTKELRKRNKEADFYRRVTRRSPHWGTVEPALRAAAIAFVGGLMDGAFSNTVGKEIRTSKAATKIQKEIAEAIVKRWMTGPPKLLVSSVNSAWDKKKRRRKPFWPILAQELHKNVWKSVEDALLKDLTGYAAGKM